MKLVLWTFILILTAVFVWCLVLLRSRFKESKVRQAELEPFADAARSPNTATSIQALLPESRYMEVNGVRLHYVQAGEGPDLVLLHGIGASVYIWRYVFPLLQTRFRVTAIDLAGFGRSSKDASRDYGLDAQTDLTAHAIANLGINKCCLIGSSMGGTLALWMAKKYRERFPELVLLAPATDPRRVPPGMHLTRVLVPIARHSLNRKTMRPLLERVVARRDRITDEVVDRYLEPFLDGGGAMHAFIGATRLLADRRIPGDLGDVRARIRVIWGDDDIQVHGDSIERLMKTLPDADLVRLEGGRHHMMEDEPEWLVEKIEEFFKSGAKA